MAAYHIVRQGEHIPGLAFRFGFLDYRAIWDHPENAALKDARQNPNVLYPGDRVFIPDKDTRVAEAATDRRHIFVLHTAALRLRIRIEKAYLGPVANTDCELRGDADPLPGSTDVNGRVEFEINPLLENASLHLNDSIEVRGRKIPMDLVVPLKIGHLDPVEHSSGQVGRLANLAYYRLPVEPVDKAELLSAVEEFQCEQGLTVDGICGSATRTKLKQVHGS